MKNKEIKISDLFSDNTFDGINGCLTDNIISEFIDKKLTEEENEIVIKHLNSCNKCFEVYSLAVSTNEKEKRPNIYRYLSLVASILIIFFIGIYFNPFNKNKSEQKIVNREPSVTRVNKLKPEHSPKLGDKVNIRKKQSSKKSLNRKIIKKSIQNNYKIKEESKNLFLYKENNSKISRKAKQKLAEKPKTLLEQNEKIGVSPSAFDTSITVSKSGKGYEIGLLSESVKKAERLTIADLNKLINLWEKKINSFGEQDKKTIIKYIKTLQKELKRRKK